MTSSAAIAAAKTRAGARVTRNAASPVCRLGHTAIMSGVIALGAGVALAVAVSMGGAGRTPGLAAAVVGVGSLISLLPGLLHLRAENWGLAVLGASMARMLLVLGLGFAADPSADRRAYWMGLVAGAVVILIAETALAVSTLARLERERVSKPAAPSAGREQVQA